MKLAEHEAVFTRSEGAGEQSIVSRRYGLYLLAFAAAYLFIFCQAVPTYVDEAFSFNQATDKSLTHMFSALRNGGGGSFPLYALVAYAWEKVFGPSEFSLRLNSGIFVLLFVWHSSRRLASHFGLAVAALAILFVLADEVFTYYALQARFYGLVIFLFSLCFWSTWDLLQSKSSSLRHHFSHALFCGLLCLSHPLGLFYTGTLALLYCVFSIPLKRFSLGSSVAFLGGPALFLVWLPSFLQQRLVNPGYIAGPPGLLKYWQFAFFYSKVLFVTLLAGLVFFMVARWFLQRGTGGAAGTLSSEPSKIGRCGNRLLVLFSVVLIVCLNGALALLDAFGIITVYWGLTVRYLLVCWVAYAVVIASIFAVAARVFRPISERYAVHLSGQARFLLPALPLLVLMVSHWGEWIRERASEEAYFSEVSKIANAHHLEVVCKNHWDAFYLATRTPTDRVAYLLDDNSPLKKFLLQVERYYPRPYPISDLAQLQKTNEYILLSNSPREARIVHPTKEQVSRSN